MKSRSFTNLFAQRICVSLRAFLVTPVALVVLLTVGTQSAQAAPSSQKPAAPILVSPENGATLDSTKPTLSWKDGGGAKNYTLEVAEAPARVKRDGSFSAPIVRQMGLTSTSYALTSTLTDGKTYAWHVLAKNGSGSSPWPETRTFKVQTSPTPSGEFSYSRQGDSARTVVTEPAGKWVATFTDKAYTVSLAGSERTFAETAERDGVTYTAQATGSTWVRVLPRPFDGGRWTRLGSSRLWPTRAPTCSS